jgi:predicted secreted acid phosphatase
MRILEKYSALFPCIQKVLMVLPTISSKSVVVDIDDTLIFDDAHLTPNVQVKNLVASLKQQQYAIHLVTARGISMQSITKSELKKLGIQYDSLAHAPERMRKNMVTTSQWKFQQRQKHGPIALSIGDQWTDFLVIETEDDLVRFDVLHGTAQTPWILVDPEDGVTSLGMKLLA